MKNQGQILPWLLGVGAVVLVGAAAASFLGGEDAGAAGQKTSIEDILQNPEQFEGQTVTVAGQVDERRGVYGFILDGGGIIINDQIPVVSAATEDIPEEGASVSVKGTVRMFELQMLEQELGVDLEDEEFADFDESDAIIVVESISPA